jgi:hypothetical protein
MTEYKFEGLWSLSNVAPSFGIMKQTKTLIGSDFRERPFFYTPVYVLYDAIEAVKALPQKTAEAVAPIIFTPEVDAALAALVGVRRDGVSEISHFPGPEASFFSIVTAMRAQVPRP